MKVTKSFSNEKFISDMQMLTKLIRIKKKNNIK